MQLLPALAVVAAFLACSPVHAADQVIGMPGEGWHIRFNAPPLTPVPTAVSGGYAGRADRLQLSFFVDPPRCAGGDTNENIYNCFANVLKKVPTVVWESERGNTVPNGVQVMYLARIATPQGPGTSFNMHLLFARQGKWADVHASIASPTKEDITLLTGIINSIVIEDDAPAGK